jgi:hypothetical protein
MMDDDGGKIWRYVISIVMPPLGLLLGVILLANSDSRERGSGRNCLLLAALGMVGWVILSGSIRGTVGGGY